MLIGVIFYFLLVCIVLALVFLPPARVWAATRASSLVTNGRSATRQAATSGQRGLSRASGSLGDAGSNARGWVNRNARWLALAVAVIVTPPLLALALRGWQELGSFDHTASHEVNEQVAGLLRGEQLVPPPALPPELFMTREVEQARPLIRYASRQWELLDEDFRKRLLIVYRLMREKHGYEMVLLEGYRSPERQEQLASLGPHVTRAGAYRSYHQHGLAADSAFHRDGRIVISETDPWAMRGYELYGEVARSVGLTWGGGWSLQDFGHTELRRAGVLGNRSDNASPRTAQEQ
jgi:peptidoglycan LD-endopeptidase CwlK